MAETLVHFLTPISTPDGLVYDARACGAEGLDGLWHAWIEFTPVGGGPMIRTGRETTQPNRQDTRYWATGLSTVYLEGALIRALDGAYPVASAEDGVPEAGYLILDRREGGDRRRRP